MITFSCMDEKEMPNESTDAKINHDIYVTVPDTTNEVNNERALAIADKLGLKNGESRGAGKTVQNIIPIYDDDGELVMYAVNYSRNAGFVIISATKDYYPVVAYNETGSFSADCPESASKIVMEGYKNEIKASKLLSEEEKLKISSQWMDYNTEKKEIANNELSRADYPDKPQVYYDSLQRWTSDPNIEVYTYEDYMKTSEYNNLMPEIKNEIRQKVGYMGNSNYGPIESTTFVLRETVNINNQIQLLNTEWHQRYPYNQFIPNQYPVGCSAVAAGQVMYYHKYPNNYNWDAMAEKYATEETARLLYDIGKAFRIYYTPTESGTTLDRMETGLTSMGYNYKEEWHDNANVLSEIHAKRPVLMIGYNDYAGHAWVCTGTNTIKRMCNIRIMTIPYRPTTYSPIDEMVEAYRFNDKLLSEAGPYFLMNYGWEKNTGWYAISDAQIVTADGTYYDLRKYWYDLLEVRPLDRNN